MISAPIPTECAKAADIPAIVELFARVLTSLPFYNAEAQRSNLAEFSLEELQRRLAENPTSIHILRSGVRLAGFYIIEEQSGPIWLDWFGVDPDHRGKGIGVALIDDLIRYGIRTGASRIWCDTRTENLASITLLKRFGFSCLCRLNHHWYGQDFFLWEKSPLK